MEIPDLLVNALLNFLFFILGVVVTYFGIIKSTQKKIEYEVDNYRMITEEMSEQFPQNSFFRLPTGEPIPSLTATTIKIENTGYNDIKAEDIAPQGQIQITAKNNIIVYDAEITKRHGSDNEFDRIVQAQSVRLTFHHFNSGEGVKIRVFHSGQDDHDPIISGTVIGGPVLSQKPVWKIHFQLYASIYLSVITTVAIFGYILLNLTTSSVASISAIIIIVVGFLFGILIVMLLSQQLFSTFYDYGLKLLKVQKW